MELLIKNLSIKIGLLETRIEDLESENKALLKDKVALGKTIDKLNEKLGLNSTNSSIPSSKEMYKHQKNERKPSNRKRRAQAGHKGNNRDKMIPDEIINVTLEELDCECGGEFCLKNGTHIKQEIDIPKIKPHVKEFHFHKYRCNKCGKKRKPTHPDSLPEGQIFGNNIKTIISSLTAFYKNSKRDVRDILKDIFNLDISLGSISNSEAKISEKCKEAYEEIESEVSNSLIVHMDETSHYNNGKMGWCWLFASKSATLIKLTDSRGKKILENSVFGPSDNIIITDRYASYNYFDSDNRQICLAHLKRDFNRFAHSKNQEISKLGVYLGGILAELFALRNLLHKNELSALLFLRRMRKLRRRMYKYLKEIAALNDAKQASGMALNMLKSEDMIWRFMYDPYNIPVTNNHAEQQIRHYVIYRKTSYFTQSERGNRFLERLISLYLTWKKQNISPHNQLLKLVST